MALHKKLNQTLKIKDEYLETQNSFYEELKERYPYIMDVNMADIANRLESELHLLLCCSLKYKSVKIQLQADSRYSNSSQTTVVNVQRGEPGFYYPQSQRGQSDVYYLDYDNYIVDNGDMWHESTEYPHNGAVVREEKEYVLLSELKKDKSRIHEDKLDAYFKILREVMAYKSKILAYLRTGQNSSDESGKCHVWKTKDLSFRITERSVDIRLLQTIRDQAYYGSSHAGSYKFMRSKNDMLSLLDYSYNEGSKFDMSVHTKLKCFIDSYPEITIMLEKEEARKKKVVETCKLFLKEIETFTTPFKVLNALTTKR